MSTLRTSSRFGLAGGTLALALALSGCGGAAAPPAVAPTGTAPSATAQAGVSVEHNDADIRFTQMMIPHHRQAVEMAEIAIGRAQKPKVKALAEQIRTAQDPEIEIMTGYLKAWGAQVPSEGGMDHSGMKDMSETSGMMTLEQMDQMHKTTGAAFDTMFLQMMISHHEGAVRDSQRELAEGVNSQAKDLANKIISAQTAEITQMRQILQGN